MNANEVPQDDENLFEGKFTLLQYALDNTGNYTQIGSKGWEPENVALKQAWDEINTKIEAARQQVLQGKASPLVYFMEKTMMDLSILAAEMGKWRWQVKRHLNPAVFQKLDLPTKEKYANIFKVSVQELTTLSE
jgi:hypothetical protein